MASNSAQPLLKRHGRTQQRQGRGSGSAPLKLIRHGVEPLRPDAAEVRSGAGFDDNVFHPQGGATHMKHMLPLILWLIAPTCTTAG